jgi:hypothetical protein
MAAVFTFDPCETAVKVAAIHTTGWLPVRAQTASLERAVEEVWEAAVWAVVEEV